MGNLTPRTPLEFLVQENNRLVSNLISVSGGGGSASSSVTSSVASSATSVQLLAANANRVEAVITNDSTAILYIKLGTGATTSDYTISLSPNESLIVDKYNGILHGVWASANGNARITETS